jgi:hypothetical protein
MMAERKGRFCNEVPGPGKKRSLKSWAPKKERSKARVRLYLTGLDLLFASECVCVCVFTCAKYAIMYACLHDSACIMCMSIHTCMYSVCITCVCEPFIYTGILYVSSVCAPCMCVWAC